MNTPAKLTKRLPAQDALRVLVIDDDVSAATSTYDLLEVLGCRGAVAFGGRVGSPIAKAFKPNLVLVDYSMPLQNGCEVLASVRSLDEPLGRALYVCVSGHDREQVEAQCLDAGFDYFVPKPLSLAQLKELIDEARERATAFGDLGAGSEPG